MGGDLSLERPPSARGERPDGLLRAHEGFIQSLGCLLSTHLLPAGNPCPALPHKRSSFSLSRGRRQALVLASAFSEPVSGS